MVGTWTVAELDEAVALLNRASRFAQFPVEQVREMLAADPGSDDSLRVCIREGGQMTAVAVAVRRGSSSRWTDSSLDSAAIKLFAVAPESRRQGVGSRLLGEIESRARALGATKLRAFGDAPAFLIPGVDYRDTEMVSFMERRGFEQARAVCNMVSDLRMASVDTAADEARLIAAGFEIRRLAASDAAAYERYLLDKWSEDWRAESIRSLQRDPVSTHIALKDGQIVGFASHSVSGPGQFGPMGTNPELRGQGVGAVLLKRCLADQKAAGLTECDIQWVGPKGFYADHVGAKISRCFWQYEKTLA